MYCSACGTQLEERYAYCHHCGRPTNPESTSPWGVPRALTRPLWARKISGVCAGFARYFDVDVTVMRIIWLVIALLTGIGFIAYLVAWVAMPAEERLAMPSPHAGNNGAAPPSRPPYPEGPSSGFEVPPSGAEQQRSGFEEYRSGFQEPGDPNAPWPQRG